MKTIVSIATKGDRPDQLKKTIASLENQCDELFIYDNTQRPNLTDMGKFFYLSQLAEPCYYFSCDDDLIYPDDYCLRMRTAIFKYGTIVTCHGRILKEPVERYYKGHDVLDFRAEQLQDKWVHVGGTGVMAFRTDYFNPVGIHESELKCMSDLVLSQEAKIQGKTIVAIKHPQNWIIQQEVLTGISKQFGKNDKKQTEIAQQILELFNHRHTTTN